MHRENRQASRLATTGGIRLHWPNCEENGWGVGWPINNGSSGECCRLALSQMTPECDRSRNAVKDSLRRAAKGVGAHSNV